MGRAQPPGQMGDQTFGSTCALRPRPPGHRPRRHRGHWRWIPVRRAGRTSPAAHLNRVSRRPGHPHLDRERTSPSDHGGAQRGHPCRRLDRVGHDRVDRRRTAVAPGGSAIGRVHSGDGRRRGAPEHRTQVALCARVPISLQRSRPLGGMRFPAVTRWDRLSHSERVRLSPCDRRGRGESGRRVWPARSRSSCSWGLSRVYLGVHWASDIVGGWGAGTVWLAAAVVAFELLLRRRQRRA